MMKHYGTGWPVYAAMVVIMTIAFIRNGSPWNAAAIGWFAALLASELADIYFDRKLDRKIEAESGE